MPTHRFVVENWVPKKLNALINMPENFDFKESIFTGILPGEVLMEEKNNSENI